MELVVFGEESYLLRVLPQVIDSLKILFLLIDGNLVFLFDRETRPTPSE